MVVADLNDTCEAWLLPWHILTRILLDCALQSNVVDDDITAAMLER
jgi:hypothetical protein